LRRFASGKHPLHSEFDAALTSLQPPSLSPSPLVPMPVAMLQAESGRFAGCFHCRVFVRTSESSPSALEDLGLKLQG